MFNSSKNKQLFLSVGIIFVTLAIGGGLYWQLGRIQNSVSAPAENPQNQSGVSKIVSEIKQLVDIPAHETPTIAEITNQEKVRSQPFFALSQTGDQVLIFSDSKKVILYRPFTGKIINIASLSDEASSSAQFVASSSAQVNHISVIIRNGTSKKGLAGKFEIQTKLALPEAQTTKENAQKSDLKSSVLVVLNPAQEQTAKVLAEKLKIPLGQLPVGESSAKADVVIILGQDKAE